jgi:two-component system, OmpR family, osmolarity sensor histidine kinase EnvZ
VTARERKPFALATHTARTLATALVLFLVISVGALFWFMIVPLSQRSADDLAALMLLSAQTWVELPPDTRSVFEDELIDRYQIWLQAEVREPLRVHAHYNPYVRFLEGALRRRTGQDIHMKRLDWEQTWYWAEIPVGQRTIRIGFPESRIGVQSPLAGLVVLLGAVAVSLLTARLLARRITRPLARLTEAANRIGRGETPELLPETGPVELAHLARDFNRMAREVRDLLSNRTTLLAGISHDLRSPLARMRVALAMLPQDADPKILARLNNDLKEMNELIASYLELARGLQHEQPQECDLGALIAQLAVIPGRAGARVAAQNCHRRLWVPVMALRRILSNLIDNAVRYGEGREIEIVCGAAEDAFCIAVLDRGPGIPEDQIEAVFRPFHRLERSRSKATGGSGLGLAIAKQLADANGWRIVLCARQGGGLEARLELPLLHVDPGLSARGAPRGTVIES